VAAAFNARTPQVARGRLSEAVTLLHAFFKGVPLPVFPNLKDQFFHLLLESTRSRRFAPLEAL